MSHLTFHRNMSASSSELRYKSSKKLSGTLLSASYSYNVPLRWLYSPDTSVDFHQVTWHCIPEDGILQLSWYPLGFQFDAAFSPLIKLNTSMMITYYFFQVACTNWKRVFQVQITNCIHNKSYTIMTMAYFKVWNSIFQEEINVPSMVLGTEHKSFTYMAN
jgi:hypothetical protein